MKNTKKKGTLHFMLYPSSTRKSWYVASCLELGLVREGKDAFKLANQVTKLSRRYVASVIKHDLDDELLNQGLPTKYLKKHKSSAEERKRKEWERVIRAMVWERPVKQKIETSAPVYASLG